MGSDQLVISLPTDHLSLATRIDIGVELKLNWEDYEILSGKRELETVLSEAGVDPGQITSVHLPPGLRTRGKDIGMAATQENVGSINDFVQGQLHELSDVFLVMHTPRKFDYHEHLSLFSTLCDLTGFEICIENPPGTSFWSNPKTSRSSHTPGQLTTGGRISTLRSTAPTFRILGIDPTRSRRKQLNRCSIALIGRWIQIPLPFAKSTGSIWTGVLKLTLHLARSSSLRKVGCRC